MSSTATSVPSSLFDVLTSPPVVAALNYNVFQYLETNPAANIVDDISNNSTLIKRERLYQTTPAFPAGGLLGQINSRVRDKFFATAVGLQRQERIRDRFVVFLDKWEALAFYIPILTLNPSKVHQPKPETSLGTRWFDLSSKFTPVAVQSFADETQRFIEGIQELLGDYDILPKLDRGAVRSDLLQTMSILVVQYWTSLEDDVSRLGIPFYEYIGEYKERASAAFDVLEALINLTNAMSVMELEVTGKDITAVVHYHYVRGLLLEYIAVAIKAGSYSDSFAISQPAVELLHQIGTDITIQMLIEDPTAAREHVTALITSVQQMLFTDATMSTFLSEGPLASSQFTKFLSAFKVFFAEYAETKTLTFPLKPTKAQIALARRFNTGAIVGKLEQHTQVAGTITTEVVLYAAANEVVNGHELLTDFMTDIRNFQTDEVTIWEQLLESPSDALAAFGEYVSFRGGVLSAAASRHILVWSQQLFDLFLSVMKFIPPPLYAIVAQVVRLLLSCIELTVLGVVLLAKPFYYAVKWFWTNVVVWPISRVRALLRFLFRALGFPDSVYGTVMRSINQIRGVMKTRPRRGVRLLLLLT